MPCIAALCHLVGCPTHSCKRGASPISGSGSSMGFARVEREETQKVPRGDKPSVNVSLGPPISCDRRRKCQSRTPLRQGGGTICFNMGNRCSCRFSSGDKLCPSPGRQMSLVSQVTKAHYQCLQRQRCHTANRQTMQPSGAPCGAPWGAARWFFQHRASGLVPTGPLRGAYFGPRGRFFAKGQ